MRQHRSLGIARRAARELQIADIMGIQLVFF